MTDDDAAIVIAGLRDDWPDGPRTLRPRPATREPNGTLWFGAELDGSGDQVWFRIDEQSIGRMPDKTPGAKGHRLVDALLAQVRNGNISLRATINRFEVRVSGTTGPETEVLQSPPRVELITPHTRG